MSEPKTKRSWTLFQRKGEDGFSVKFKDDGGVWRQQRLPLDFKSESEARRYAMAWLAQLDQLGGLRPSDAVAPHGGEVR